MFFTPIPSLAIPGMTFSRATDCKTLGVPYIAPKQLDIDDTYNPAYRKACTAETFAAIMKSVKRESRLQVAPKNRTNARYRNVPVLIADKVPLGISVEGALKSPLMLIPDRMPVIVGKNTPKTVNQL